MSRDIQEGRERNGCLDVYICLHVVLRHRLGVGILDRSFKWVGGVFASKLTPEGQARFLSAGSKKGRLVP